MVESINANEMKLDFVLWRIRLGFRVDWFKPNVLTLILLEWVENEAFGVLWIGFCGVFIGVGYGKHFK